MNEDEIDGEYLDSYDSPPTEEALLTQQEAAEIFGVSRQTFTAWRKQGLIPTYGLGTGRAIRFKASDVEALQIKLREIKRIDQ